MSSNNYKLDNPVWYSLSESHYDFALDYSHIKFYHPDYCTFGGFSSGENISDFIDEYSRICDNFFVVGEKPPFSKLLNLKNELICDQMVLDKEIRIDIRESVVKLDHEHSEELFRLVNLVQPGYFKRKTFLLGNYYGIFKNKKLIAVTGERMKMNANIEVSAVVTHPDHTGKGYARQLVAYTASKIQDQDKTPYLHVSETNSAAINLYKKLGFVARKKISFWNLVTNKKQSL